MKPVVFSVEDDVNIQNVINIALSNSNYDIQIFERADQLIKALENQLPDIFLLDIMLPDVDGLEILKKLRKDPRYSQIPVMIISAKITEVDRVIGLDAGADDYLIKPFGVLELVSRVRALLRRFHQKSKDEVMEVKNLKINPTKFICSYQNEELKFTKKQFELLLLLMKNHNTIISRDEILNTVWGYEYIGETRTIDVHIKEIRRKLKGVGLNEQVIETVRGIGYRFIL
ncbi:MAG: response regulator transcription factor [Bacilli bacterium]|nr:response regulator transcription factor [Bacilli bacterium]